MNLRVGEAGFGSTQGSRRLGDSSLGIAVPRGGRTQSHLPQSTGRPAAEERVPCPAAMATAPLGISDFLGAIPKDRVGADAPGTSKASRDPLPGRPFLTEKRRPPRALFLASEKTIVRIPQTDPGLPPRGQRGHPSRDTGLCHSSRRRRAPPSWYTKGLHSFCFFFF
jgi:hypothetical protein